MRIIEVSARVQELFLEEIGSKFNLWPRGIVIFANFALKTFLCLKTSSLLNFRDNNEIWSLQH